MLDKTGNDTGTGGAVPLLSAYFTKAQLARELGRHPRTLDRWLALGEGPPVTRLGRDILFNRDAVVRWLAERQQS